MSVAKMPTAQCSFLHTSTARHIPGLAHIKSTHVDCALNVVNVPTTQCPQTLHTACLTVSVKTKPTYIQSAQADGVFQCSKCARCPVPTFTHRHDKPHGTRPARSLLASRHRRVERGQAAHCDQRAPRLERCKHGVYVTAYRSSLVATMSRPEPRSHSTPSYSCKCMGKASRGI